MKRLATGIWMGLLLLSFSLPGYTGDQMNEKKKDLKSATFAGGCFWCTESGFEKLPGVKEAISGYTGGQVEKPTYS